METASIKDVLQWMKSTDLVEVAFKRGGQGFALSTADAPAPIPGGTMPASRFTPVSSESVGVFQWNVPGQARKAEEGTEVAAGDVLGVVVSGAGVPAPVKAPAAGRVA